MRDGVETMQLRFQYGDEPIILNVEPDEDGWRVLLLDGTTHRLAVRRLPDDVLHITTSLLGASEHRAFLAPFARTGRGTEFSLQGQTFLFTAPAARQTGEKSGRASGSLTAPMVGVVADVLVEEGQTVEAYQPLAIVEAMKVMATVEAPFAGKVKSVHVQKGQRVDHGALVIEVVPNNGTTDEHR